jgi:hypothetical protein
MPDASELDVIAKIGVDIKNGDKVTITGAGAFIEFKQKDGTVRTRLQIPIQCVSGNVKTMTLNETTRRGLIEAFGNHTEDWVNKQATVSLVKQNVGGELKDVAYLEA